MDFVIDASIAAAWVIDDEQNEAADRLFDQLETNQGHVPALFWYEMRNILLLVERRGRAAEGSAEPAMHKLHGLPITTSDVSEDNESFVLARRHRLTAYDTLYPQIAVNLSISLATADRRLASAAREAGVMVLGPSATLAP